MGFWDRKYKTLWFVLIIILNVKSLSSNFYKSFPSLSNSHQQLMKPAQVHKINNSGNSDIHIYERTSYTLQGNALGWLSHLFTTWVWFLIDCYLMLNIFNITSVSQGSYRALTEQWNSSSKTHIPGGRLLGCLSTCQWSLCWSPLCSGLQGWTLGPRSTGALPSPRHWLCWLVQEQALLKAASLGTRFRPRTNSVSLLYHLVPLCFHFSISSFLSFSLYTAKT